MRLQRACSMSICRTGRNNDSPGSGRDDEKHGSKRFASLAAQDLAARDLAAQDVLRYASHSKLTRFGATSFGALDDLRRH